MTTAVEWLIEQMIKCELLPKSIHPDNVLFHKAKEIETKQIIDAFEDGYGSGYRDNGKLVSEYYKECFVVNRGGSK